MKKTVSIFDYRTGIEFLNAVYKSISDKNSRYSLRSFAQKIDLDQSTLVRYFAKERFLSSDKCAVVAERLGLNEVETHYFKLLTLFGDKGEFDILEKLRMSFSFQESTAKTISSESNPFLSVDFGLDLRSHLIYELQSMAKDLSIADIVKIMNRFFHADELQVADMINKLIQQGFLEEETRKQRQEIIKKVFLPTAAVPREAGIRFHKDALNVAKMALDNFTESDIEIYTSTIAIKSEGRAKILQAVQHLHGVVSEYMAEEGADDIFLVSSFMVNLTSPGSRAK